MKKGISPVVAVVLLIAIAVIAAVGVWSWIGAYTSKPNVQTSTKSFSVKSCSSDYKKVLIYNNGGEILDGNVSLYYSNGTDTGLHLVINNLGIGDTTYVNVENASGDNVALTSGVTYQVVEEGYSAISFIC